MNRLTIIGNLCADPQLRTTTSGKQVCSFTVAVNRRRTQGGQPEADYFAVSAWNQLGENCAKYLAKGRKVAVVGSVSVHTYQAQDGTARAQLDVMAQDVEFLSARAEAEQKSDEMVQQAERVMTGQRQVTYTEVEPPEDLPF